MRSSKSVKRSLFPKSVTFFLKQRAFECAGLFLIGIGLFLLTCFMNYDPLDNSYNVSINGPTENFFGELGAYMSDLAFQYLGFTRYFIIVLFTFWGLKIALQHTIKGIFIRLLLLPFTTLVLSTCFYIISNKNMGISGVLGFGCYQFIFSVQNGIISGLPSPIIASVITLCATLLLLYTLNLSTREWKKILSHFVTSSYAIASAITVPLVILAKKLAKSPQIENVRASRERQAPSLKETPSFDHTISIEEKNNQISKTEEDPLHFEIVQPSIQNQQKPTTTTSKNTTARPLELSEARNIALPPLNLLKQNPEGTSAFQPLSSAEIHENARLLKTVLEDFGVRGEIAKVHPGPVVTLYEFIPAAGIKSSRIIGLADDIARSMSALSARIAVIPGRNAIGIELPNETRQMVYLHELLSHEHFNRHHATLAIALGKNIGGEPVIADLARMPHLLVAGTTGSGKSVGVNAMILSILYRLPPERCRFIMIDPKMLELSIYDGIPHLLTPVVTDPRKAVFALKWAVREMEDRYRSMSRLGVRNIEGYNLRLTQARERGEELTRRIQTGFDEMGQPIFETEHLDMTPLSYIVIVVDEMADLMLVAGKEIESAVQRLAQMARAAGIHLIMATQRPSVDVITGTIKANFPTRISFQVASRFDSRTILNEQGAEQLLGRGDMLFMEPGGKILRVHGPFVGDDEVENVVKFLKSQGAPEYIETITAESNDMSIDLFGNNSDGGDELYNQALEIIRREKKASTSFIQRHLKIGYNRAARIIEQMEAEGIVSSANHVGKREVLLDAG